MPDISLCSTAEECPMSSRCYRALAEPNPLWQTYSDFQYDPDTEECDGFWDILGED